MLICSQTKRYLDDLLADAFGDLPVAYSRSGDECHELLAVEGTHETLPERYLEIFVTESWGEHLRQHERITAEDRKAEERALSFHLGARPPRITHFIAEELPR